MREKNPTVAVTLGDPAGIGPEIVAKAFAGENLAHRHRAVVIGDETILKRAVDLCGLSLRVNVVDGPEDGVYEPGTIDLVAASSLAGDLPFGELDSRAGGAAYGYVETAVRLALEGRVEAVCTAPLNKEALHLAGLEYPGHTEILARLTDTRDYAMMLVAPDLRVIHVSTHVSLRQAVERATPERELAVMRLAHETLRRIGIEEPRIAVSGLNPHAGENGLFGDEEAQKIEPAVSAARDEGLRVSGPFSADTVFNRASGGDFDIVVVQYHDQGHIPIKLLGFESGVNVTVGLPFFRTSVDHGTAFDIAGTGEADHASLLAALDLARELALAGAGERSWRRTSSPVTNEQISRAVEAGFSDIPLAPERLIDPTEADEACDEAVREAVAVLNSAHSAVLHTCKGPDDPRRETAGHRLRELGQDPQDAASGGGRAIGKALGSILKATLERVDLRRIVVAGGDTSGYVAQGLDIQALEMAAPLSPGSPLCRVHAPGTARDGTEIVFKGGQVGGENYFISVLHGS